MATEKKIRALHRKYEKERKRLWDRTVPRGDDFDRDAWLAWWYTARDGEVYPCRVQLASNNFKRVRISPDLSTADCPKEAQKAYFVAAGRAWPTMKAAEVDAAFRAMSTCFKMEEKYAQSKQEFARLAARVK